MRPSAARHVIEAALGASARDVTSKSAGAWSFVLRNGRPFHAGASVRDDWLVFEAPLAAASTRCGSPTGAWELLRSNAMLAGGARVALGGRGGLRVLADVPLDADVDLGPRVRDVCDGLLTAKALLTGAPSADHLGGAAGEPSSMPTDALLESCREAGWPARREEAGWPTVDLDVPGAWLRATLVSRGIGTVAQVPLFEEPAGLLADDTCRHAVAILLLRMGAIVRMARACARSGGDGPQPCFEVPLSRRPSAAELSHAFGALSVACRVAAREALVLGHDASVAALYLQQWNERNTNDEEEDER